MHNASKPVTKPLFKLESWEKYQWTQTKRKVSTFHLLGTSSQGQIPGRAVSPVCLLPEAPSRLLEKVVVLLVQYGSTLSSFLSRFEYSPNNYFWGFWAVNSPDPLLKITYNRYTSMSELKLFCHIIAFCMRFWLMPWLRGSIVAHLHPSTANLSFQVEATLSYDKAMPQHPATEANVALTLPW